MAKGVKPVTGILEAFILAIPRWLFAVAAVCFVVAMVSSWFSGDPFVIGGYPFGWSRPHASEPIVSRPRNETEWQQRKYAVELLMMEEIKQDEMLKCYPEFRTSGVAGKGPVITTDEAEQIISGGTARHKALYDEIRNALDRFEALSAAYRNGVVDARMFEDSYKKVITVWYGRLHHFMEMANKICDCTWPPFEELGKKWWQDKLLPERTGFNSSCVPDPKKP